MTTSISLIVPTCGRHSLHRAALSFLLQAGHEDEIVVVGDGPTPSSRGCMEQLAREFPEHKVRYFETEQPTRDVGNAQRQLGMEKATGSWLAFLDDDDILDRFAITVMRKCMAQGRPLLFRTRYPNGLLLWKQAGRIIVGNVGTPNIVVPNDPAKLGRWGTGYSADFEFVKETVEKFGDVRFVDQITCHTRQPPISNHGAICRKGDIDPLVDWVSKEGDRR